MPGKREGVCLQTPERGGGAEVLEMTKRKDRWAPVANPTQGFLRERFRDLVVSRNGSGVRASATLTLNPPWPTARPWWVAHVCLLHRTAGEAGASVLSNK